MVRWAARVQSARPYLLAFISAQRRSMFSVQSSAHYVAEGDWIPQFLILSEHRVHDVLLGWACFVLVVLVA